jgi:hypothetical protein
LHFKKCGQSIKCGESNYFGGRWGDFGFSFYFEGKEPVKVGECVKKL